MTKLFQCVNPKILFLCSIACLPTVFMQENLSFKWISVLVFIIFLYLKTGKIRLLPSLIIIVSIVFFNVLTPSGKILFEIGQFKLTENALINGLEKASLLISMVFISQYAISKNLNFRGRLGYFISTMFYFFDKLTEHKARFNAKKPIESIDSILCEVYSEDLSLAKQRKREETKHNVVEWLLCLTPLFITYTLLLISAI